MSENSELAIQNDAIDNTTECIYTAYNLLVSNNTNMILSNNTDYTSLTIYNKYKYNGCDAINDKQKRNIFNAKYTDIKNTLIHFIDKHNHADFLTEFINYGPDVNSQNANGNTHLHIVLDNTTECKYTAYNLLVSNNTNMILSNNTDYTPLNIYNKYKCNGCDAINDKTNSKNAKSQTIVVPSKYDSNWRRWLFILWNKTKI